MPYLKPPVSYCVRFRFLAKMETDEDYELSPWTLQHSWVGPLPTCEKPVEKEEPVMSKPVPAPAPVPVLPAAPPSDIATRLQQAFWKKAEEEARPSLAAVEAVHDDLAAFSVAIKQQAEEKALAAMLAAVGDTAPTPLDLGPIQKKLRTSLAALLELVGHPFDQGGAAVPASPVTVPAPCESGPVSSDRLSVEEADMDEGEIRAVIARVDALANFRWKEQPLPRLLPLLQEYVAEVRYWQGLVDASSPLHWQLGQTVKVLAAIKYDSGIRDFVHGLAHDATGDWLKLSAEAHNKVWKFDADADAALLLSYKKEPTSKAPKTDEEPRSFSWPLFPNLRGLTRPLVLLGGIPVPNKIANIYERFGFEVEWVEVYRNKGDISAVNRVSNGTVGAVVILEKFLGHRTSEKVVEVCRAHGIPWAYGGNAGTATLQRALELLESKSAA